MYNSDSMSVIQSYTFVEVTKLRTSFEYISSSFGLRNKVSRGMKSSWTIMECRVEIICGDSALTSCNMGRPINGGDKEIQQRFFSKTLVLIRGDFHKEAVTDNASVPPKEKPIW